MCTCSLYCLQLKITHVPKQHIFGRSALNAFAGMMRLELQVQRTAEDLWDAERGSGSRSKTPHLALLVLEGFTLCNHRQAFSTREGHGNCLPYIEHIGPRSERKVGCNKRTQVRTPSHLCHRSIPEPVTKVSGMEVTP